MFVFRTGRYTAPLVRGPVEFSYGSDSESRTDDTVGRNSRAGFERGTVVEDPFETGYGLG